MGEGRGPRAEDAKTRNWDSFEIVLTHVLLPELYRLALLNFDSLQSYRALTYLVGNSV